MPLDQVNGHRGPQRRAAGEEGAVRATSMPDVGDYHERLVLQTFRRAGGEGASQAEVAASSGLSRQGVSVITRRLLARGALVPVGRRIGGRGKPSTLLQVVPDVGFAIGVHLDPWFLTLTACDLLARPVASRRLAAPGPDADADLSRMLTAVQELCDELGEGRRAPVLGVGIAAPAGIDAGRGLVLDPPWLPGWRDVPVVRMVHEATGLPTILAKDTSAALTAERWSQDLPVEESVLYLYAGSGLGSAVALEGRVSAGRSGQAGEIGHLPTGWAGPVCPCGRRACVSLFTDVARLLEGTAAEAFAHPVAGLRDLVCAAEAGDGELRERIRRHGAAVGEVVMALLGIHDAHRVVIGGPTWRLLRPLAEPALHGQVRRRGAGAMLARIRSSEMSDDVAAIGAASLVLDRELSPRPSITTSR